MKQIEFKTRKGEFLIVEFPQGVVPIRGDVIERTWVLPRLPEGKWLLICRADEIDEEQAKEVVGDPHFIQIFRSKLGPFYTDYTNQGKSMMSAKYSLETLLEANGVYFDAGNTYIPHTLGRMSNVEHLEYTLDVLERKSGVWNKQQTYLFKKL